MAKSALPLLIGVGAIALIATSGKKKAAKKKEDFFEIPDNGGGDDVYVPPKTEPKPKPADTRPSGSPPRGETYDGTYWHATPGGPRLESIRNHFKELGYGVNVGPWPMNVMGPLKGESGSTEYTNEDGTKGWSGGGDDQPSAIVKQFQADYNRVSKLNKAEKIYAQNMGGLDVDGLVGPLTLNALRYAKEGLPGGKKWSDLLQMAALKGIS